MIQQDKPQWAEITREERYFTSFLFHDIRKNPTSFLQLLKARDLKCGDNAAVVDVGYEVCFFRDGSKGRAGQPGIIEPYKDLLNKSKTEIEKKFDNKQRINVDSLNFIKQTFDLVLWLSDSSMVIIEAKAHEGFTNKQINYLDIARMMIKASERYHPKEVYLVGLASSKYKCRIKSRFDAYCTWKLIANCYPGRRDKFEYAYADEVYGI